MTIHAHPRMRVYGIRKIHAELNRQGTVVARCTIERLCRELVIRGVVRGNYPRTTRPAPETLRPADLVKREFCADGPNRIWVADITYVRTMTGWVYVAFILDVFSRMIVGWQTSKRMYKDTENSPDPRSSYKPHSIALAESPHLLLRLWSGAIFPEIVQPLDLLEPVVKLAAFVSVELIDRNGFVGSCP